VNGAGDGPESQTDVRAFRFEREMLEPLISTLLPLLGFRAPTTSQEVTVVQTPAIGNVIPDLLVGRWRDTPSGHLAAITFVEASALSFIDSLGSISPSQFSDRFHLTERAADLALQKLATRSFLGVNARGEYYLDQAANPRSCELIAVEVKLSRWRDALDQAVSYLTFADYSYVVLDGARFIARPESMNQFRSAGVGLLLQYGHFLQPVLDGQAHQPTTADRFVALKHLTKAQKARINISPPTNH